LVYDPATDAFSDLDGSNSLPLGVFEDADYNESQRQLSPGQVILIATDGIWEARNPDGNMFGKDRIYQIVRQNAAASAVDIQNAVLDSLRSFQKDTRLEDDLTLVVIKITAND
jgi:sigma-B regulation protein RsbU (phosphoserine phosphatase)